MKILRNIFRRKLRAILTILGIVIGVFALVVMGAMAEKMTLLVSGGTKYYADKVDVSTDAFGGMFGINVLTKEKIAEIEKVDGVKAASGYVSTTLDDEMSMMNFGPPASLGGSDFRTKELDDKGFKINYYQGRELKPDDIGKAAVGSDLVKKLDAKVGGKIKVRGKEFEVVGIAEKTLTSPDTTVFISLKEAQEIVYETLPDLVKKSISPSDVFTSITVYPKDGLSPDDLAKRIKDSVKEVAATGPDAFQKQIGNSMAIFTSIIFGIAMISLLVGGLSVTNTMTMSISERTREIGIRKAIGASKGKLIKQFIVESAIMSLIGGLIGLFLGWLFVLGVNAAGNASGTALFLITPRLAIGSVLFALTLGVVSGFFPAWRASKMNPVEALKYE
ncbi:ABC transporter permease [bacterium]|nr:ABC transporter permease [bacterium]